MKKNSFTLLEVIIAITVLTVAVGGSFALIQQILIASSLNQSKLIAYYLAQEGIEIVKNIRDSNWLEPGVSWNNGLDVGEWEVDFDDSELTPYSGDHFLNIDENGFYSYSPGTSTQFKREISILEIGEDALEVSVDVQWSERGRTHNIEVLDHLYNWWHGH